jgi:hypothetical protein
MKQTAVEWFAEQMTTNGKLTPELFEQAKEIEKQYIKDAFIMGINNGIHGYKTSEEYYEKTYKK